MDRRRKNKQARRTNTTTTTTCCSNEANSIEREFNMSEQEEDLIYRMYRLVGDSWALIAGRISGRKAAEEIERFWVMRHGEAFADRKRRQQQQQLTREKS